MRPGSVYVAVVVCAACVLAADASAESLQLPVTQDNSIVMVDGEWNDNAGQQGRLRIKGNQHIVIMNFDLSKIAGRRVRRATLVCTPSDNSITGVTISTIATPWDESQSTALTAGLSNQKDWGYRDARFPAVSGGNSFTLVENTDTKLTDGKYHWDISADLVHAMSIGIAHGVAIHEHDADYSRNPTIFSREQSGKKPVLQVELDDQPDNPPQSPTGLQLEAVDSDSGRLTLMAPASGFAYEVFVDGHVLPRHNIPLVTEGQAQQISLRDLPDSIHNDEPHEVRVICLNRTGQRSQPAIVQGAVFRKELIEKPAISFLPPQNSAVAGVSVIPLTDKYDANGNAVGDLPAAYRTHNPVFDGRQVRLIAAAGEVVGFQTLIRGNSPASFEVKLKDPSLRVDVNHAVYVSSAGRRIPDPLLPLSDPVPLTPDSDQCIVTDIFIPFYQSPGAIEGAIIVSDGRSIPLEITVLPFALPRQVSFFCEMNSYGLPDRVQEYYALQQIGYDHRVHSNVLHYSHNTAAPGSRKSNLDMRLLSGKRMDNKRYDDIRPGDQSAYWDDFAEAFGPYIDGSMFEKGHRGPIPAPGFYLTFHESWPLNCRAYFNGNPDAYQAFAEQPLYAETYVNVLQSFTKLAHSKGWTKTGFQVYFNNKGSLQEKSKAPWILDEPSGHWDYRALQFYGELTDRGRAAASDVQIDYRVDISRPEYCRGQLEHRPDLWVVSSWAFQHYRRLVTDRIERDGLRAWIYGTSNHVHETNRNISAWALDSWQYGATGIVPWQTVDKSGQALREADQLGLFIFDEGPDGTSVIRHSLRLKAYREAQQLIEYLNILQRQRGWTLRQMQQFVAQYVNLDSEVLKTDEADAGTAAYGRVSAPGLESLRRAAAQLISKSTTESGKK